MGMAPEISRSMPPYAQVADHIREQIVSGELKPGDRIPSVRELAGTWKIARATAEKAVGRLVTDGLVVTRPGAGAVVSSNPPIHRSVQDRYRHARETGRIYTPGEHAKILSAELVPAPKEVAAKLGLDPGSPVVRRHRVTYFGDAPSSSSTSWFAGEMADVAPQLLTLERIREGTGRYVEQVTGRTITITEDEVSARLATDEEAAELDLTPPVAVFVTKHIAFDERGQPLTYEVGLAQPGRATIYRSVLAAGQPDEENP